MLIEFRMMLTSGRKDIGFGREEQEELSGTIKVFYILIWIVVIYINTYF